MIRIFKYNSTIHRLFLFQIIDGKLCRSLGMIFCLWSMYEMIDGKRIDQILHSIPFVNITEFRFRMCIAQQSVQSRKTAILVGDKRRNFRCFASPSSVTVKFRSYSGKHGGPVRSTRWREDRTVIQCRSSFFHQPIEIGHGMITDSNSTQSVKSNQYHMLGTFLQTWAGRAYFTDK